MEGGASPRHHRVVSLRNVRNEQLHVRSCDDVRLDGRKPRINVVWRALALIQSIIDAEATRRAIVIVTVEREAIAPRQTLGNDDCQYAEEREVEDRDHLRAADVREQWNEDRADEALCRPPVAE